MVVNRVHGKTMPVVARGRLEWKIFLIVWIFLSANVSQFGPQLNTMVKSILLLSMTLVDHNQIMLDRQIDPYVPRMLPENIDNIPSQHLHLLADLSYYAGHYYSGMPPGLSWAGVPVYIVIKSVTKLIPQTNKGFKEFAPSEITRLVLAVALTVLFVAPLTALAAVLMLRILITLGATPNNAIWGVVAFVWGSLFVLYGTFVSHNAVGALLAFVTFAIIFSEWNRAPGRKVTSPIRLFGAGLLAGLAVTTEYSEVLTIVVLLGYSCLRLGVKRSVIFMLGIGIVAALHGYYAYVAFDSAIDTPYAHRFLPIYGARGLYYLVYPHVGKIWKLCFGPVRGIFIFMPWALISCGSALMVIRLKTRFHIEAWCTLTVVVSFLLYNSSIDPHLPAYGFGARFMIGAIPFLVVGLGFMPGLLNHKSVRSLIALAVILDGLVLLAGSPMGTGETFGSAHIYVMKLIAEYGPRTQVMRVLSTNVHSLSWPANVLLFSVWVSVLTVVCISAARIVDRIYGMNQTGHIGKNGRGGLGVG